MAQNSHAGRPSSWLAVIVILLGFGVGGAALVPEPKWWLFWTGTGIVVVGGIIALSVRIFDDVIMDGPRVVAEERHRSELAASGHGQVAGHRSVSSDPERGKWHG